MISSLAFIPRGAAKETPEQQELSAEEMDQLIQKQAGMTLGELDQQGAQESDEEEEEAAAPKKSSSAGKAMSDSSDSDEDMDDEKKDEEDMDDKEKALMKELKMDGYDEEPEGAELMLGGQKLVVFENNADDPYVTVPDHEDFDEEDDEDLQVKQSDVMICVGKTEEEASTLEVYLYEEEGGKLYVHHDFNLPSFPLSLCWMDADPRSAAATSNASSSAPSSFTSNENAGKGSFLAVGTFQSGIEIWNLDVLDVLEPVASLGGRDEPDADTIRAIVEEEQQKKKKKGKKSAMKAATAAKLMGELKPGSHADAVMSLAWHNAQRSRLASGSADHTIKLWDVCTQQCVTTFNNVHKNKVQSLNWNYVEPNILLSGSYDQTACMVDIRANTAKNEGVARFNVPADIEQVRWSPHQPSVFAVAMENGCVQFFDARNSAQGSAKATMFTVSAHTGAATNVSFNAHLQHCFLTSGLDKTVKIWDFSSTPSLVTTKDMKAVGSIFSASFDVNYPHLVSAGGDKGKIAIWDLREDSNCRAKYGEECDGKMGRGSSAFDAGAAAASSSSSSAPKKKKEEKKPMKTSIRRAPRDAEEQ